MCLMSIFSFGLHGSDNKDTWTNDNTDTCYFCLVMGLLEKEEGWYSTFIVVVYLIVIVHIMLKLNTLLMNNKLAWCVESGSDHMNEQIKQLSSWRLSFIYHFVLTMSFFFKICYIKSNLHITCALLQTDLKKILI